MIIRLCGIELLKIRRSLVLLMTLACPMAVVFLMFLVTLRNTPPSEMTPERWGIVWMSVSAMWSWFMLPLFVALSTALINGNEHRNHTWRLMLSLPIRRSELYAAKAIVAILLLLTAHLVLLLSTTLTIALLGQFDYPMAGAFNIEPTQMLWAAPVAALPLLVIHHALSWRLTSVVPPLAIGVVATFAGTQIGSSEYWMWWPWTYPLVSTNAATETARASALLIGLTMGAGLFVLSAWWLTKREVT